MFKLKKNKLDEYGLTLIEVLVTIVLTVTIAIFSFSFLTNSINTQKKIIIENNIRDEADLIMSNLVKNFYTLKENEVRNTEFDDINKKYLIYTSILESSCSKPTSVEYKNNCLITGFSPATVDENTIMKLNIKNQEYLVSNPYITIHKDSYIKSSTSTNKKVSYHIKLALQYDNKKFSKVYYFENQIQSIPDIKN